VQILSRSQIVKAKDWKLSISNNKYYQFIEEKVNQNEITTKDFYIVINNSNVQLLENNIRAITRCLRSCDLEPDKPIEIEYKELIPDEMHPNYIKYDNMYNRTLFVYDWPCSCGWLTDLFNSEINMDVAMFINPVDKVEAIKFLKKRLIQNTSNSVIEEETSGDIESDIYDENIVSAIKMRDELIQNTGKFFFMATYITIKAKTLTELEQKSSYVRHILQGVGIEVYSCFLKQDLGYKCTLPYGIDSINWNYNITTESLKTLFPFITTNVIDRNGVMIGDNLLNNSLVFLDPFKYNSALMFVLGKVGSGKSYLVKLLALRLLYMGVEVDIWDKTGEYEPLKQLTNLSNLHVHHYDTIEEYQKHMQKYILEMDSNVRLKKRFLIIDEFWEYLDNNYIMAKIEYISRTGRKKHQGLCVITQLIEDLNKSQRAKSILRMASIKTLMQMEPNAAKVVQNILDITDEEVNFLISAQNEGILFAGSRHVQFKAAASEEEDIIIDTNPENRVKRQEFKEVAAGVIKETTC
jgi:hypothetical protein